MPKKVDVKLELLNIDKVLKNLAKEIKKIKGRNISGLGAAALFVKGESQKNTPVDTGHLKNSAYTKLNKEREYAEIGYTAFYAPFVHEIDKNYTVGGWKFLARALNDNVRKILSIISSRAIIK